LAEVAEAGEDAECGGKWQVELLEADSYFGSEDGTGGGSVEGDVSGLVGLEEVAVDGDGVVDGGGKFVLGREAIEDGDDAGVGEVGDGDGLGEGAGVGVEAAAVDVDEDAVGVHGCGVEREDVADGDSRDGDGFDFDWIGFEGGLTRAGLPGVGAGAALGEGLVFGSGGAAEGGLGLGADGGGDGDDTGDVRGAVGVVAAGVGRGGGGLLRGEGGGEGQEGCEMAKLHRGLG